MSFKILYKPQALIDINEIFDFLAIEAGLDIALRFSLGVEEVANKILIYPKIGIKRTYSKNENLNLRMLPISDIGSYLLYYTLEETEIVVVRVVHGSRDMENQF
jgi:toxin ParE1/3/4